MVIKLETVLEKEIWGLKSVIIRDKSIMLLYSRGYSMTEISCILGLSQQAISYRLKRLRKNKEVYEMLH